MEDSEPDGDRLADAKSQTETPKGAENIKH